MKQPRISIVIAVLNAANDIGCLLNSIKAQRYQEIEVIVMDGGSRDGTVLLLEQRSDEIDFWVSAPDSGIYPAWNKALNHCTGEYICFLGADDYWACEESLEKLASLAADGIELVSAKFKMVWPGGTACMESGSAWSWDELSREMNLSHRGMLHHRSLFTRYGHFDEGYRIAGDYEFLLRCGKDLKTAFLNEVTIIAGVEGISMSRQGLSLRERFRAHRAQKSVSCVMSAWLFVKDYGWIYGGKIIRKLNRAVS